MTCPRDSHDSPIDGLTRSDLVKRGVVAGAALTTFSRVKPVWALPFSGSQESEIRIGIIDDHTGDFALANIPKTHGYQLAIDQINAKGGINGRKLRAIVYDGQSDVKRYQELAQKLILGDKVNVIMAGYTSSEREAARSVAVKYKTIFWHNNQGEGGIASKYSFFTGPVPEQQILPGIKYMIDKFGPRMYILAADYGFGHVSTLWAWVAAGLYGGKVVGEEFIPLGNSQFVATINRVQSKKPDFMVHYLVGANQSQFYPQASSSGLTGKDGIPMISTVNLQQGYEHKRFPPPALWNMYVPTDYQEEISGSANARFVKAWRSKWPKEPYINEPGRSAYVAVNYMAKAWKLAGTTDTNKVIEALESGITFDAPEGRVRLDPATHHTAMKIYNAYVDRNHKLRFPNNFGLIEPWWLKKNMKVDLRKRDPEKQFLPQDDPSFRKYTKGSKA